MQPGQGQPGNITGRLEDVRKTLRVGSLLTYRLAIELLQRQQHKVDARGIDRCAAPNGAFADRQREPPHGLWPPQPGAPEVISDGAPVALNRGELIEATRQGRLQTVHQLSLPSAAQALSQYGYAHPAWRDRALRRRWRSIAPPRADAGEYNRSTAPRRPKS